MNRSETILKLKSIKDRLESVQRELMKISGDFVTRKGIKDETLSIASEWFQEIEQVLERIGIQDKTIIQYHQQFDLLLRLSIPKNSRKKTFLGIIQELQSTFVKDLMIPTYKSRDTVYVPESLNDIILNSTPSEQEYLEEARNCVKEGYLRAAIILGWNAAIDRMQKAIEKQGFDEFNKRSLEMKNKTTGRYKRFNKKFDISTLNEFRATVFDHDMMWVLEYWQLIDSNQHDRLSTCYVMRNNSAHPGEAIISDENLASFFADLKMYVFDNPDFQL